jgi:hypothetical protein
MARLYLRTLHIKTRDEARLTWLIFLCLPPATLLAASACGASSMRRNIELDFRTTPFENTPARKDAPSLAGPRTLQMKQ